MSEEYFGGSLNKLQKHWNNKRRALKFQKGQSRTVAVKYMISKIETDIHMGSWLDTGTGSGFIQSHVHQDIQPILFVGLDFSRTMLEAQLSPLGERIQSTTFQLPFRKRSFSLISNFFSLSDYPDIDPAFREFFEVMDSSGIFVYLDYSKGDDYWETRKLFHDKKIGKQEIIGNINLRSIEDIERMLEVNFRVTHRETISYDVSSSEFNSDFDLPEIVNRKFLFCMTYKPRSS